MKKTFKKSISLFLAMVMAITVIPSTTYAMEEFENNYEFSADEVSIEYEIESKRTENSKTYLTDDGGYYQVSTAVPIHNEVNGKLEEISEINTKIETVEDAENAVSEIAAYSVSNPAETGFYESETLTMYTNGVDTNPMKIAGSNKTVNGIDSCIYVKPSIITDKQVFINNATLNISTGTVETNGNADTSNTINVYRLRNKLNQVQNVPLSTVDNVIIDRQMAASDTTDECKLDITSYAHYSSLGLYENTGLALEPLSEDTYIEINSIVLGIYYREIGDVDKTIESETVDLDRAGTLYVNDYTCSPLIVRNDLSVYDELAQVNVQTIINPAAIDNNPSDGINTRTNYYSILQYENGEYYWKNCEGEYIFFIHSSGNNFVGSNSSGDKYILSSDSRERIDYSKITIESEKDNTKYHFSTIDSNGYVTKIEYVFTEGEGENKVEITYDGENISYITDGSNRKYRYNYENDLLTSISVYYIANGTEQPAKVNGKNIAVQYSYDENHRLNKVTYPDGYYVSYSYDENGRILNVTAYENSSSNSAGIDLTLNYQNGTAKSNVLSKYTLKTNGVVSNEVEINSPMDNTYNRVFSDILNKSEKIMHYDQNSNLIHYKDYNGQEYYLNYTNGELQHLIYEDASSRNIISNGDFENGNSWTLSKGGAASYTNNAPIKENSNSNNSAISFMANNKSGNATQEISVTPTKSYVLCCSAYCKQTLPFKNNGNNNDKKNNRYFSVRVYGAASGKLVGETYFDYNIVNSWQTSKVVIDIPETISKVKIEINSLNMPGECYFDDLSMYVATKDNAPPFNGNPEIPNYEIIRNEYGQVTDIIKKRSSDNKTFGKHYEYDENTHYKTSVEEAGKVTYYNYDCGSGLLTSKGKNTDSSKNTQYTYSGIGALTTVQQAITTAEGETVNQTVEYTYDDNDRISSVYHNGCRYEYTYNENGKVSNVRVRESEDENAKTDYSISYEYNLDNVGKVTFGNGASIVYEYDGDNITKTIYDNGKSGDEKETYVYSYKYNSDGSVSEMTDEVSNTVTTYTSKGSTVKKNGSTIYSNTGSRINLFGTSFSYSQSSSESRDKTTTTIKDSYTGSLSGPIVKAETVLDTFGRTMNTSIVNKGDYDKNTHYQLTSFTEYVEGHDKRQTTLVSHYKTKLLKRNQKSLTEKYDDTRISADWYYRYDNVGRVTSVFKDSKNNIALAPANKTSYTYNKGDLARYYQYDEGGQISLEVNFENNTAIRYYFNEGGNISKKVNYTNLTADDYSYDYSTDKLSFNPKSNGTITNLTYKSNGMTDYLTGYDGKTITYDKAGNPLDYAGSGMDYSSISGTMTWNGDLLTSFSKGNDIYKYTYDGDGKRTSKTYYESKHDTVPTSRIEYIWDGDIITGYRAQFYGEPTENDSPSPSNTGEKVLYYDKTVKVIYSNNDIVGVCVVANEGEPSDKNTSIEINDAIKKLDWDQSANYTFVKDGQGNITEIYDPSEKVIISMSYDAYGNMTPNYMGTFVQDILNQYKGQQTGTWWIDLISAFVCALVIAMYLSGIFVSVEQGFKGYIYDIETGLYYGQKRYYSPAWGRFINASDPMTLTEDMSSVYNSNLFNYCGNDPVNNITKTGFNAPDQVISDSFVPQLVNSTNNLIKENRSTAKYFGEISTGLDTLSLGLRTTLDADAKSYWDETLNKQKDVVDNGYGFNYIQSAINKSTSSVTKYSVNEQNTLYKVSESID